MLARLKLNTLPCFHLYERKNIVVANFYGHMAELACKVKTLRLGPVSPEDVINPLKVVLMSATLQLKDFISNRRLFDVMPLALNVPARQFPVSVHFSKRTHDDYLWHAYKKVMSIHKRLPLGGILVFVTGQQEVNYLCKKLQRASKQQTDKKPEKVEGDESSSSPDEKEIYEAYDDMFSWKMR
jgi:ATP-dependent RNA helicase DHX37/DHR1